MPLCKILVSYENAEKWQQGDIVDVTHPWELIREGKVELYVGEKSIPSDGDNADSKVEQPKPSKKKSK